ncbi:MAG: methylmalonyl-CoA mutase small subunit [Marinilabiliales bacterium]|nr:MAG: methylmalonyl-CoA mutase small subunit [Marinilabiliales bacterium]
MKEEKLFQEFEAVTTDQWKEKIIKDLKGADYDRKLVWKTNNGFDLQPFYRREDLENLTYLNSLPGEFPFTRGSKTQANNWKVNQLIKVDNIAEANKTALDIRFKGVDSIAFVFDNSYIPTEKDVEDLLENIRVDEMEVNFKTAYPVLLLEIIDSLARKYNRNIDKIKGSVFCDPISEYSSGKKTDFDSVDEFHKVEKAFKAAEHLVNFHCLTIDGSIFHNAGATTVTEMALSISMAVEYLNKLTDKGFTADGLSKHIRFNFATGASYFVEIAKLRALRFLWAKIMNEYGIKNADSAKMYIHSLSSSRNKTIYDPYVNMLRTTTETMSAALGGADSITVIPFDIHLNKDSILGKRIARNQQLLLKGESYFDKVNDPAAGSYYIETITDNLIQSAWKLFLEIEEKGGYLKAFEYGFIADLISQEADELVKDVAFRKRIILGTNQYPNTNEQFAEVEITNEAKAGGKFLSPIRISAEFEELRNRTDRYSTGNSRPKVWMFTYGNLAMRKARAQFATGFFGCAGFDIIDNLGFKTIEEGVKAAKEAKPDIVVLCSSDEEYADMAPQAFDSLKNEALVVIAGYPKNIIENLNEIGLTNFINIKSNVLGELKRYQSELGI